MQAENKVNPIHRTAIDSIIPKDQQQQYEQWKYGCKMRNEFLQPFGFARFIFSLMLF